MPTITEPQGHLTWEMRDHDTAEITNIVVNPSYRGEGIGRRLMDRFIDEMSKARVYYVYVFSELDNQGAHKFYERCGFTLWGSTPDFYKHNGAVIMGRLV